MAYKVSTRIIFVEKSNGIFALGLVFFCNEENGIFVLGVVLFSSFQLAILTDFFLYHSKGIVVLSSNLKKKSPVIIFCKVMGV